MDMRTAARRVGMKETEITDVVRTDDGVVITTCDGQQMIDVPAHRPDGEGKTGLMFFRRPHSKKSAVEFPVFAPHAPAPEAPPAPPEASALPASLPPPAPEPEPVKPPASLPPPAPEPEPVNPPAKKAAATKTPAKKAVAKKAPASKEASADG